MILDVFLEPRSVSPRVSDDPRVRTVEIPLMAKAVVLWKVVAPLINVEPALKLITGAVTVSVVAVMPPVTTVKFVVVTLSVS